MTQLVTIDGHRQYMFDEREADALCRYFGCDDSTPSERLAELRAEHRSAWRTRATFEDMMKTFKEKKS